VAPVVRHDRDHDLPHLLRGRGIARGNLLDRGDVAEEELDDGVPEQLRLALEVVVDVRSVGVRRLGDVGERRVGEALLVEDRHRDVDQVLSAFEVLGAPFGGRFSATALQSVVAWSAHRMVRVHVDDPQIFRRVAPTVGRRHVSRRVRLQHADGYLVGTGNSSAALAATNTILSF